MDGDTNRQQRLRNEVTERYRGEGYCTINHSSLLRANTSVLELSPKPHRKAAASSMRLLEGLGQACGVDARVPKYCRFRYIDEAMRFLAHKISGMDTISRTREGVLAAKG